MFSDHNRILRVPTNIITGFLGVGKTSAILHLLACKPAHERWAVLVNEFGEIGVDGSLLQGQSGESQEVFIREVPGGCMCCSAGLPMNVALNQLLTKSKPHRLLIEPTGLGHPQEVLNTLLVDNYKDVLLLQKTLTLVDARKLSDLRYTQHDTFNQQIAVADTIVANKVDLYQKEDKTRLIDYIKQRGKPQAQVLFTQYGEIDLSQLQGTSATPLIQSHHHHLQKNPSKAIASKAPFPDCGYIKAINKGEGFFSVGWRFVHNKIFDHKTLLTCLSCIQVERMKAVFITNAGVFAYNLESDDLSEVKLNYCHESRIEIISEHINDAVEAQLLACIIT